jgi:hypothetical protein
VKARHVDAALLFVGLAILWAIPHSIGGDAEIRFQALAALLKEGRLAAPRYSMVGPIFATPLFYAGLTAFYNVAIFTLALGFFWRELRDLRLLVLLVFASMFPNHVQVFYGEPFTALTVTAGVLLLTRDRTLPGWALVVLGAVNTPSSVLGVAGIALLEVRRTKRWSLLLLPGLVVALCLLENLVVRGHPMRTGYHGDAGFKTVMPYSGKPDFSYPMLFGLLAIVLSFGKGLLFFTPGLFVPPAGDADVRLRRVRALLVAFVVGLVVVYSRWWAWYGGIFWGPRFFLIASVPACLVLHTHLASTAPRSPRMNALVAGALGLSFWVGVNGIAFDLAGMQICSANDYALEMLCHFTPEYSPLWHPLVDPSVIRPLAVVVCLFWAAACGWVGRDVFRQLARDLRELVTRGAQERT